MCPEVCLYICIEIYSKTFFCLLYNILKCVCMHKLIISDCCVVIFIIIYYKNNYQLDIVTPRTARIWMSTPLFPYKK